MKRDESNLELTNKKARRKVLFSCIQHEVPT